MRTGMLCAAIVASVLCVAPGFRVLPVPVTSSATCAPAMGLLLQSRTITVMVDVSAPFAMSPEVGLAVTVDD